MIAARLVITCCFHGFSTVITSFLSGLPTETGYIYRIWEFLIFMQRLITRICRTSSLLCSLITKIHYVMNQNQLRCLSAAFALLLFSSCKVRQVSIHNTHDIPQPKIKPAAVNTSPKGGPQFTGREVRAEFAIPCFRRYVELMNAHGFVTSPKGKVTLHVEEEMITTSVSYDGEPMIEWMQRMLKAFPGTEPKDIGFLMVPGHLDEKFLTEVGEDPANWPYKLNRVSIFMVPVRKSEGAQFRQMVRGLFKSVSIPASFQNGPPMWELGGVQP